MTRKSLMFSLPIFLSAFLLFLVQPLIAKYFLPWFGGSSAVWATSMVIFQLLLLAGYAYAHVGSVVINPRSHAWIHLVLLGVALLVIGGQLWSWGVPILPDSTWSPESLEQPILKMTLLLVVAIGLPYFLLTTTSPLLQYWFGFWESDTSPYRLYALSNAGSLLGLLAYPLVFEQFMAIPLQGAVWGTLFVVTLISIGATAWQLLESSALEASTDNLPEKRLTLPSWTDGVLWFFWAAFPSVLFLAVTNRLSEIAPVVPFLWVLPLVIYLLSLIICFSDWDLYNRGLFSGLWFPSVLVSCLTLFYTLQMAIPYHVVILAYTLFIGCMIGHGELVARKPHKRDLTVFYLFMAGGGAFGGIFVSIISPWLFSAYWEFHVALFVGMIVVFVVLAKDLSSWLNAVPKWVAAPLILFVWLPLELALLVHIQQVREGSTHLSRNFYGVTRVVTKGVNSPLPAKRILIDGATRHGSQFLARQRRFEPTGYFARRGGVGRAMRFHPKRRGSKPMDVGVVGLGAGVLASYGQEGDHFRFYEINPDVIELSTAKDAPFTFVKNCPCETTIVPGDGRLSLRREMDRNGSHEFDLLVLDAFQSDAPPAHLLTIEAFELFLSHTDENGIMAFNTTNRFLKLHQLIHRYVQIKGLSDIQIMWTKGFSTSRWLLVSRSDEVFQHPGFQNSLKKRLEDRGDIPVWTDHYSNLLSIMKWDS